ncbi:MAG: hypothetical protein IJ736_10395, partial [Firmicutes bacterium]|nr:hypothetical protein [Bacillota bacterium]
MKNKTNMQKLWFAWLLGFAALSWLILHFVMRYPSWTVIIAVMIYVFLSMIIFKGYFFGMSGNYYLMTNRIEKAVMMNEMAVKHNTGNVKAL